MKMPNDAERFPVDELHGMRPLICIQRGVGDPRPESAYEHEMSALLFFFSFRLILAA